MIPSSVDLPEPDGPMIPTSSPSWTSRETSDRATVGGAPGYSFATRLEADDRGAGRDRRSCRDHDLVARRDAGPLDLDHRPVVDAGGHLHEVRRSRRGHLDPEAAVGQDDERGDRDRQRVRRGAGRDVREQVGPSRSARAAGSVAAAMTSTDGPCGGPLPVSGGATATAATLTIVPGIAVPSVVVNRIWSPGWMDGASCGSTASLTISSTDVRSSIGAPGRAAPPTATCALPTRTAAGRTIASPRRRIPVASTWRIVCQRWTARVVA